MSPTHVGVPNHRMRYYILCERSDRFFQRDTMRGVKAPVNENDDDSIISGVDLAEDPLSVENDEPFSVGSQHQATRPISDFLLDVGEGEDFDSEMTSELIVPDLVLERDWAKDIPIVTPRDRHSHCFTAFYARQIHRATGSILLMEDYRESKCNTYDNYRRVEPPSNISNSSELDRSDMTKYAGKLRRFAPEELLALFGFPKGFSFPPHMKISHKFKLVGNSISVFVVKALVRELVFGSAGCSIPATGSITPSSGKGGSGTLPHEDGVLLK